jgi:hypothetical protein
VASCLAAATLGGCQAKSAPRTTAQPISEERLSELRTTLLQSGNKVRVALVTDVLADSDFASVSESSPGDFPVGSNVSIIDGLNNVLAQGEIVRVVDGTAHIRFTQTGARRPTRGDAAVKF